MEWRSSDPSALIDAFAAVPYNITHGIVLPPPSPPLAALTIPSSMFLHAGVAHLGFNLLFLLAFGPSVESLCGHARFAALYLICGIVGEIAQIAVDPMSHLPTIGASGAIAGVLGAHIVSYPFRFASFLVIGVWAAAQFASGYGQLSAHVAGENAGVATFVHIGGFACGVVLVGLFRRRDAGMRTSLW